MAFPLITFVETRNLSSLTPNPQTLQVYGGMMIGSLTEAFSYDIPLITFVGPLNSATTGGITVTVWSEPSPFQP